MAKRHAKKKARRKARRRNRNPGVPRIIVATGNPRRGHMKRIKHRRHHRKHRSNPRRVHHRRRRRNPAGGIGKILMYAALGLGAGAVAFAVPELANLSGAKAYLPGVALVGVGAFLAKKNPLLGISIATGAAAGTGAPFVASKILPAASNAPSTSAVISALGPRMPAPRMAALIQGIGDVGAVYEPRADMLTRGV
jgi:hypothetical protein